MNKLLLILASLTLLHISSAKELIDLTSSDGRLISVSIDNYNPRTDKVSVRINGKGRLTTFKLDRLNDASKESIKEWHKLYSIVKSLSIHTERLPARDRSDRIFDITLTSAAETDIEDIRIDYSIPIKESSMVQKESSSSGKNAKTKYEKVVEEKVIRGTIDVGTITARTSRHVNSESVAISSTQTIKQGKGDAKEVTNNHSIKGILLEIYVGDQMVREYESQNGVKQLIEKYEGE